MPIRNNAQMQNVSTYIPRKIIIEKIIYFDVVTIQKKNKKKVLKFKHRQRIFNPRLPNFSIKTCTHFISFDTFLVSSLKNKQVFLLSQLIYLFIY